MKDAEDNAEADKARKEMIEAKNQADSLIYETEKSLKEHGDKIEASVKEEVENKINKLKEELQKSDAKADEVKKLTEDLMQSSMKIGEAIYKNSSANAGSSQDSSANNEQSSSPKNDGSKVVDGEFEGVSEEDKK